VPLQFSLVSRSSLLQDTDGESRAIINCVFLLLFVVVNVNIFQITWRLLVQGDVNMKQDAVGDDRLRPRCRHLAKWTKHTRHGDGDSGLYDLLYENTTPYETGST